MSHDGNNDLICPEPVHDYSRWHALAHNTLQHSPAVRLLYAVGDDCRAAAFSYMYPDEAGGLGAVRCDGAQLQVQHAKCSTTVWPDACLLSRLPRPHPS